MTASQILGKTKFPPKSRRVMVEGKAYRRYESPHGDIIMKLETEWPLNDPAAMASIESGMADSLAGRIHRSRR